MDHTFIKQTVPEIQTQPAADVHNAYAELGFSAGSRTGPRDTAKLCIAQQIARIFQPPKKPNHLLTCLKNPASNQNSFFPSKRFLGQFKQ